MARLLVVAGEASGDRMASEVVAALRSASSTSHEIFGLGGDDLAQQGVELVAHLRSISTMGVGGVVRRAAPLLRAYRAVVREAKERRPRAALLVNFTEFNLRLAAKLRSTGVPVHWYVAPQVWAWRKQRMRALRACVTRLYVILPFEEALFRKAGIDALYVGHPSLERMERLDTKRPHANATRRGIALLPGSRAGEIRRLLPDFLRASRDMRLDGAKEEPRTLFVARSLDGDTARFAESKAREEGVPIESGESDLVRRLEAFRVSLVASGTASLEAALAGATPVVAYRLDPISAFVARRLVSVDHVALPNLLLERRAYTELLLEQVTVPNLRRALARANACDSSAERERLRLLLGPQRRPSLAVAEGVSATLGESPSLRGTA